jgi:hypothetical protein
MELLYYNICTELALISIKDHISTWDEFHVPVTLSISPQHLQLQQAESVTTCKAIFQLDGKSSIS